MPECRKDATRDANLDRLDVVHVETVAKLVDTRRTAFVRAL